MRMSTMDNNASCSSWSGGWVAWVVGGLGRLGGGWFGEGWFGWFGWWVDDDDDQW